MSHLTKGGSFHIKLKLEEILMLQSILEHLNQIIAIAATGFGGYVGRQVIKLISSHLKGFYAKVAVEFVEQTANDLAG